MNQSRRSFLRMTGSVAAGGVLLGSAFGAGDDAGNKLILSAPLTHSDWMLKGDVAWGMDGVRHMLDACKACGWTRVFWRVFDAGQATYPSRLLKPAAHPEDDNFHNPQTDVDRAFQRRIAPGLTAARAAEILKQLKAMDYGEFDSLAAAVEYGHHIGLKIDAWATINEDDHGWGWRSEFAKQHPEFRWVRRDGTSYRSQMSFAFPEVRAYKLALMDELLANYDIDGLFIDWIRTGDIRDNPQTDAQGVADSGYEEPNVAAFRSRYGGDPHDVPNGDENWVRTRAQPQTLFMRELRERTNKHRKRMPVAVMVGHPWHYRGLQDPIDGNLRGLLLDVGAWAKEGLIDAAVPAGYYRAGGTPEKAYRALVDETAGQVDVWYYAWVSQTPAEFIQDFERAQRSGAGQMLFWEADYIDDRAHAAELKAAMAARSREAKTH